MTDLTSIDQAIVHDEALRSVRFFNGRLLTGRDLTREQEARREADRRLGQAAGSGVAWGLEVTPVAGFSTDSPLASVAAGLAVNPRGQALMLPAPVDLALAHRVTPRPGPARTFKGCEGLTAGRYSIGPGVYLLTIAPAEDDEGRALTHALDDSAVPCNVDVTVETVRLRFIKFDELIDSDLLKDTARLRNALAYECFGATELLGFRADPYGAPAHPAPLLTRLRERGLSDCDVPLAVVALAKSPSASFVDAWPVRRRITRRAVAGAWSPLVDDRRRADGEAMFLQFQDQIEGLLPAGTTTTGWTLKDRFHYLPPAGIIPVPGERKQAEVFLGKLLSGLTTRGPAFIEGARLEPLLRASHAFPPIDLASGELIWLHYVRENWQAIDYKATPTPRAYLVFSSGHMPYQADARFNVGKWNYANVALDR